MAAEEVEGSEEAEAERGNSDTRLQVLEYGFETKTVLGSIVSMPLLISFVPSVQVVHVIRHIPAGGP